MDHASDLVSLVQRLQDERDDLLERLTRTRNVMDQLAAELKEAEDAWGDTEFWEKCRLGRSLALYREL
jgi:hypothetical protein